MKKLILLIALTTTSLYGASVSGETNLQTADWELADQSEQTKVYVRKVADQPSLREIKASINVPQSPKTLMNLMIDYPNAATWRRRIKGMELVRTIDDDNWYVNYTTDMPWPIADRIILLKCQVIRYAETGRVDYSFKSVPAFDGKKPEEQLEGEYSFTPLPDGQTEVTYRVTIESPLKVPAWLENSLMGDAFLTQMEMLRKAAALPQYVSHQ
ncbi:MAG: hypothetical protein KUG80_04920 [Gammaproteobacteria bacterium]|nr:hypothetical protein [Gammaproteobacteria bacterium]